MGFELHKARLFQISTTSVNKSNETGSRTGAFLCLAKFSVMLFTCVGGAGNLVQSGEKKDDR